MIQINASFPHRWQIAYAMAERGASEYGTFLLAQAERYRQLAMDVMDEQAEQALLALAAEYEQRAAALPESHAVPPQ